MQEHVALQSKGHDYRETRRIGNRILLQRTGEEMNQSSQNVSGHQNASSQLNTDRLETAHVTKVLFVCHGNICR